MNIADPAGQDPTYQLPKNVIAKVGSWTLYGAEEVKSTHKAWIDAFTDLFTVCVKQLDEKFPLPNGTCGHVILAGEQANMDWSVDENALGFQAVCATISCEDGEMEYDLPDDHRCYLNLDAHQDALNHEVDDEHSRLAALITLPHEMAHVALFARHTNGRSPMEMFDATGGVEIFQEIHDLLDEHDGATSRHGAHEDQAENFGSDVVDAWLSQFPKAGELIKNLRVPKKKASINRQLDPHRLVKQTIDLNPDATHRGPIKRNKP